MRIYNFLPFLFASVGISEQLQHRCQRDAPFQIPDYIDPRFHYRSAQSGFQLFTNLVVPCDGNLVAWAYKARTQTVNLLHLAVYRKLGISSFKNVGETFVDKYQVPKGKQGKWIDIYLDDPIKVNAGDMIGLYYDTHRIFEDQIPIAIEEFPPQRINTSLPTYVFLAGSSVGGRIFDVREAAISYRLPALQATVFPKYSTLNKYVPPVFTTSAAPAKPPSWISNYPRCHMNPLKNNDIGPCEESSVKRYAYFHTEKGECVEYDGCPPDNANGNYFVSLEMCIMRCHTWNPFEVCLNPPASPNSCIFPSQRYFYSPQTDECEKFTGCSGLGDVQTNNFASLQECKVCKAYSWAVLGKDPIEPVIWTQEGSEPINLPIKPLDFELMAPTILLPIKPRIIPRS